ncbi:unnamed protein product [Hyaloperonospora brassicae]|uniref:Chitin-binding type-4 domain-containing protein n=1 Tax=Hyaloperonospora brassicae TaxID=162125 RepID=A0AAV0SYJ0_HYABA|nr:unnamed protein product [Hyaloperonospora brassicae]
MKTVVASSLLAATTVVSFLASPTSVSAHGQMTRPTARPISQSFRADCGALSGAGDQELQYAPVELLQSRAQADRPAGPTFNILNGCRGTVYELNNTVTELEADTPFDVEWIIQAPHPGTMVLSVVRPRVDGRGVITYEAVAKLLTIDPFAVSSSEKTSTVAIIPSSVTACGSAGDCALQFYWHSDLAGQTYPTCGDIVVTRSGQSASETLTVAPMAPGSAPTSADSRAGGGLETDGPKSGNNASSDVPLETSPTAKKRCTRRQQQSSAESSAL